MKQSTFIALLLTFIMVIMVLVAAVVFLTQRNRNLVGDSLAQATTEAVIIAQSDQLDSDLAVRQAALESAEATRQALESQLAGNQQQIQDLEQELEQKENALQQADQDLLDRAVQLFIFSPKEGAIVPPLDPLTLFIAARADAGVESISISINDETLSDFPAEGQPTYTVRTEWMPPDEGQYHISAVAQDREGQVSSEETIAIEAAYSSPEARAAALLRRTEADIRSLRFPGGLESAAEIEPAAPSIEQLHSQIPLLSEGGQSGMDPLTRQVLNLESAPLDESQQAGEPFQYYFDTADQQLVRYQPDSKSEAFDRWVHVHEFAHQMMADAHGLSDLDLSDLDGDTQLALAALTEGEATFLQYLYAQGDYLSPADKVALDDDLSEAATDTPDEIVGELSFIYGDGFRFIQTLYNAGGYAAVDQAWTHLPQSSEQILHPDRFLNGDTPLTVTLSLATDELDGSWQMVSEDVMGEYLLRQHLTASGLEAEQVNQAATGWGGGQFAHYRSNSGDNVLIMRLAWDSAQDESEFSTAYADLLTRAYNGTGTALPGGDQCWEGDDATCLYVQEGETLIIRAPNLELVDEVRSAV